MPVSTRRKIAGILALGIGLGCSHPKAGDVAPDDDRAPNSEISILVRNHNFLDMTIYLLRGSSPERLGTVPGISDKILLVPWRRLEGVSEVRLGADPIGQDQGIRTDLLTVRRGSIVEWTLETELSRSYVAVY